MARRLQQRCTHRIEMWQGGSGSVTGITVSDIQMENTSNRIIIDQSHCLSKARLNQTSGVPYSNIQGTYNHLCTLPITVPCTNITTSEAELLPAQDQLIDDTFFWNAYGAQQTLTTPPIDLMAPPSLFFSEAAPETNNARFGQQSRSHRIHCKGPQAPKTPRAAPFLSGVPSVP
ncbi:hypothetical protein Ancab_008491 [Ancistrocladus abbreviatus]